MTERALNDYKKARAERLGRNDARRIRAERDKARSPTSGAPRRWPFELLQNTHDPGPRAGANVVDVRLSAADSELVFQHNGRPFTSEDLAALLSGGSNKEYESAETTGRFGTGFLVTHVLSPVIDLRGLMGNGPSFEQFELELDRSGDEDAILSDMKAAEASIKAAQPIDKLNGLWTAHFRYPVDNHEAALIGVECLQQCAPYLFGTQPHEELRRVETFRGARRRRSRE